MKLAGKPADKKHPLGYGRIEYLSSAIISLIVIYAGVTSLVSSAKQIIHPEEADYSAVSLAIVGVAVIVKLVLGAYVKKTGRKVNSDALVASGTDAFFDAVISLSTLIAAGIYLIFHISTEAYLGVIISVVIIKSGIDLIRETLSKILGERIDGELSKEIKKTICEIDDVYGAYDLVLNNYGPDSYLASVHIEVPDHLTADRIDEITREIQKRILEKFNIYIAAVGIYSLNTQNETAIEIRETMEKIIRTHDHILQIHGFYFNEKTNTVSVDFVISFDEKQPRELLSAVKAECAARYPEYRFDINMDTDISD